MPVESRTRRSDASRSRSPGRGCFATERWYGACHGEECGRIPFESPGETLGGLTLAHTVVIGGGICGLAAGLTLAERGQQVTVLEAQDFLGGLATTLRGTTGAGFVSGVE